MDKSAFFNITYGLYVISSAVAGNRSGFVSNTVMQVSSSPSRIAISASKDNFTTRLILDSKKFAISVLQKDVDKKLIETFGYKSGKDFDKFASVKYKTGADNLPIVIDSCSAYFECEVFQLIDLGSHILFIANVVEGEIIAEADPLTYSYYRSYFKGKSPKSAPTYFEPVAESALKDIYVCEICGYEYDSAKGDPDGGIAPGTKFEDIPVSWRCPVCGLDKTNFSKK